MKNLSSKEKNEKFFLTDPIYRISGITIQYYYTCHRELWFHLHYFDPIEEHHHLSIGRIIHEQSYKKMSKRTINIGTSVVDIITKQKSTIIISEIKKSSKFLEPSKKQLLYYLLLLKRQGIKAQGILRIPKEKKNYRLKLTPDVEKELVNTEQEILRIAKFPRPPPIVTRPYCKSCAYLEICEA